jgi:branched-chain amino acid transport system substrate-binding protein
MLRNIARRRLVATLGGAVLAALCLSPSSARAAEPVKVGFGMALTGALAGNGKAALIAMEIWRDDVNKAGGLLGRQVEFTYYDDQTNPATVPGIYTKLLNVDKVDLVVSGYGTNVIAPAIPIMMNRKKVFMGLFGLAANEEFKYPNYFQIMPAGPDPKLDWSRGFFEIAAGLSPKPTTVALVGADAEFARNALDGAKTNAEKAGLKIVYNNTYPPSTTDYTPVVRAIQANNPDVVFIASYPPDSAGMVRAIAEVGLKAKLLGGGMVGLQYAALLTKLGPMLNGIVNYDFWVPAPTLNFPGVNEFLTKYQAKAKDAGVDPLGHYLPPYAYAYMQVLGQAVNGAKTLDDAKLADYIRGHEFETIIGKVKFGKNGEWATTRVLQVQYQNVKPDDMAQFIKPGTRAVLYPKEWKFGELKVPFGQ